MKVFFNIKVGRLINQVELLDSITLYEKIQEDHTVFINLLSPFNDFEDIVENYLLKNFIGLMCSEYDSNG